MRRFFAFVVACCLPLAAAPAADPTITDAAGKDIVLKNWKISAGMRKLSWLEKDGVAPEALVFRETNSTSFRDGVQTLVPLSRLESLTYDAEKQTVQAKLAGVEMPLEGTTRFQGINQIALEAEVDKGTAGTVELKYRGGVAKGGIRSVRFPDAKPGEAPVGDKLFVTIADGKKKEATQAVFGLQVLYRIDKGAEKLLPTITFKKTFKVELSQIKKMTLQEQADQKTFECEVTLKDGSEQTLTLLTSLVIDGKPATLEGFVAAAPAGYKLFPLHTIGEISVDGPKEEKNDK